MKIKSPQRSSEVDADYDPSPHDERAPGQKEVDWKNFTPPKSEDLDWFKIALSSEWNLHREAVLANVVKDYVKDGVVRWKMRSAKWFTKPEEDACKKHIEYTLTRLDRNTLRLFKDRAEANNNLRKQISDMYLIARYIVRSKGIRKEDEWLAEKHDGLDSFEEMRQERIASLLRVNFLDVDFSMIDAHV